MNSRVSVAIQWEPTSGTHHAEQGFTRVVNGYGCLLVSPKDIDLEQGIRLTNLSTRQMANGVVVWKGTRRTDGWELGVELIAASLDFWGVEL
jgi:hypothetical protein